MANENRGGRRLAGNRTAPVSVPRQNPTPDAAPRDASNDALVDEILRSISEPNGAAEMPRRRTVQPVYTPRTPDPGQTASQPVIPSVDVPYGTGHTDPAYYAMRDPSQTQSFQPARPAKRDTDRIPTMVEEKPVRRKSALGKVLTFLVTILVIVALVLSVKMVYTLAPSMGWNLPDLTKLPGISQLVNMLPENNPQPAEDNTPIQVEPAPVEAAAPTAVSLDAADITLQEGESYVLTASVDVENWNGTVTWASSKPEVATVTPLTANTAQVTYVSQGECAIAAVVSTGVGSASDAPHASCFVVCEQASNEEMPADEGMDTPPEEAPAETGEHVDIALNREDFTLKVGERHQLMSENADKVTWTSSNEAVATVGETGIVTAVSAGTATITATGPDGTTASAIARIK